MNHPATLPLPELVKACRFQSLRRSGPGGQHRNKVETAVIVTHIPSDVSAEANERRSQEENRKQAMQRLRVNLAVLIRSDVTPDSSPTPLWQSRTRQGRIAVNPNHADFPALLAEALDHVAAAAGDVKTAAERLGCSASQLVKLLKVEPRAFAAVNAARLQNGRRPLK
ncbi:MAG: peptide chain release factor-like protein [Pirellulales bacterium]